MAEECRSTQELSCLCGLQRERERERVEEVSPNFAKDGDRNYRGKELRGVMGRRREREGDGGIGWTGHVYEHNWPNFKLFKFVFLPPSFWNFYSHPNQSFKISNEPPQNLQCCPNFCKKKFQLNSILNDLFTLEK